MCKFQWLFFLHFFWFPSDTMPICKCIKNDFSSIIFFLYFFSFVSRFISIPCTMWMLDISNRRRGFIKRRKRQHIISTRLFTYEMFVDFDGISVASLHKLLLWSVCAFDWIVTAAIPQDRKWHSCVSSQQKSFGGDTKNCTEFNEKWLNYTFCMNLLFFFVPLSFFIRNRGQKKIEYYFFSILIEFAIIFWPEMIFEGDTNAHYVFQLFFL